VSDAKGVLYDTTIAAPDTPVGQFCANAKPRRP